MRGRETSNTGSAHSSTSEVGINEEEARYLTIACPHSRSSQGKECHDTVAVSGSDVC